MRLECLRGLIELEKAGSINAAAKHLYLSQQGLSRMIGSLENELGTKLVERSHTGITFTEAGCIALVHAKKVVHQLDEMRQRIAQLDRESLVVPLELVLSPYAAITLLGKIMERESRAALLNTDEWDKSQIRDFLRAGSAGKLFLYDWTAPASSTGSTDEALAGTRGKTGSPIFFRPLLSARFGLMCRKGAIGEHGDEIPVEVAESLRLVSYRGKDYQQTLREVLGAECFRNVTFKVSDGAALAAFVGKNEGTGMLLDSYSFASSSHRAPQLDFIPLANVPHLVVGFAFFADDPKAANYMNFIEVFRKTFEPLDSNPFY